MKDSLIFASNNLHKVEEIRSILGNDFDILTLKEAGINIEIPEPHETLEENALEKSGTILLLTGKNCFSEDTGLEVEALCGEPGVKSARYAGVGSSADANTEKLLYNLTATDNRKARFRTVIALMLDGKELLFEGICTGTIITGKRGAFGFGYDPVFIPDGSTQTFAEMNMTEKNKFSHRKKAVEKLVAYLKKI